LEANPKPAATRLVSSAGLTPRWKPASASKLIGISILIAFPGFATIPLAPACAGESPICCYIGAGRKLLSSPFAIVGFEKPAEGKIRVPETPSQNPAGQGENRQNIKNE